MPKPFTARDNSSTHSGSSTLRYQHRIVWDDDKKLWNCVKCHRSSGYANKHSERLRDPDVAETERQAMNAAIRSLNLIRRTDIGIAA